MQKENMVRRLNCFLDLWRDKHSYTFQQTRASEFKAPDMGTLTREDEGRENLHVADVDSDETSNTHLLMLEMVIV